MSKYIDRFNNIKRDYTQFKEDSKNSKLRIRDISNKLNVSEAELLSLSTNNGVSFLSINDYLLLPVPTLSKFFFAHTPHNQM